MRLWIPILIITAASTLARAAEYAPVPPKADHTLVLNNQTNQPKPQVQEPKTKAENKPTLLLPVGRTYTYGYTFPKHSPRAISLKEHIMAVGITRESIVRLKVGKDDTTLTINGIHDGTTVITLETLEGSNIVLICEVTGWKGERRENAKRFEAIANVMKQANARRDTSQSN